MYTDTQIIQLISGFFAVVFLSLLVPVISDWLRQRNVPKLTEIAVLPPDEEAKFKRWFAHFEQEQLKAASNGDKALANPLDFSADGIPNPEELRIFEQIVKSAGYGAHINGSIKPVEHITIYWN